MLQFKIENNDLKIVSGEFETVENSIAVAQLIQSRLRTFAREWFLNNSIGIDYFNQVLVDNYNIPKIESIFKTEILETTNVDEMLDFNISIDRQNRVLEISFKCNTTFGDTIEDIINITIGVG